RFHLLLHEVAEPVDRGVPALRYLVEIAARRFELRRLQLPNPFAPTTPAAHQTGVGKDLQVLGNGLT
ncbi:MAG TPA: hypothetical protein VKT77_22235, partial [Chthonomonadaceae bacterium]|nr:hypothetical protein [Chthonomonadaceae bacterium]